MSYSIFANAVTKSSAGWIPRIWAVAALALTGLCGAAAHAEELTRMAPVEAMRPGGSDDCDRQRGYP